MPRLNREKKILTEDIKSFDGFQNFSAKLGLQTANLSAVGQYTIGNLISRNRAQLEYIYRTSWIAGQVIDTVAEDMTKEGISMMSKMSPDDIQKLSANMTSLGIWQKICSTIKWARLYGGAIAVMLIDGADYEKPFDVTKVRKGSFKGLAVFDRWQLEPSYNDLVTELGPDMGKPKFYKILPAMETMSTIKVHYSRVVRLEGIEMPYYQKKYDNLWGMSVIERMLDRLMAFDSATQGAAQLIYKAHLRVVQIDGLRQALAMGGKTESAVIKQFQYIRLMQTNEGITLLDKNDTFTPHQYTFSGLADMLIQFGQQISGAVNIPLVRLFGQSPSGFNSGEADLRNYYDNVGKLQESMLRMPVHKILETLCMSVNGKPLPDDFEFDFNSLWQPSEVEKSQIVNSDVTALNTAFQSGMITKKIAMKELAQNSHTTGRFSNITDEDIENAQEEPPEHQDMGGGGEEENQEVDLKGLQEKLGQKEPEPEADDVVEKKSLEQLEAELNGLGGSEGKTLEDLEKELRNLDPPTLEQLEKELSKLGPETTFEQLEETLRNIKVNTDPELMKLEKQLNEIDTSMPITPTKKMTIDNKGLLSRAWDSFKRIFTGDEQLRAPKGGVTVKGKKFKGGEFIPTAGGYATEYKKMKKKGNQPQSSASNLQEKVGKRNKKEKLRALKEKISKGLIPEKNKPARVKREKRDPANAAVWGETKRDKDGKLVTAEGNALPKHLQGIAIPPGYSNVIYNKNPKGDILYIGIDKKGKKQYKYSQSHRDKKKAEKFARVSEMGKQFNKILNQVNDDLNNSDAETKERALIAKLIMVSAIRPGGDKDTGADVKAYGAITLEARHFVEKEGKLHLDFIAKKGVHYEAPINDKHVVGALRKIIAKKKPNEKVFNTDYMSLLKYTKGLDGGKFKTKDFRTLLGTRHAIGAMENVSTPTNEKEYKKALKAVATVVAKELGNTPAVALQSYINPAVFAEWKMKAGA